MRILIAAPRKAGNAHLRCLLATAYGLSTIDSRDAPAPGDAAALAEWLRALPDDCVVNTDFAFSPALADEARAHGITLVAILRHPFDLFVSNHDVAQQRARRDKGSGTAWQHLAGTALDHPRVLAYIDEGFATEVAWLTGWSQSEAPVVRYETLERDPAAALAGLAPLLGSLGDDAIARAVALCPPENVVHSRPEKGRRMPALPAGAWRERLPALTLGRLQARFGEAVSRLGYEVTEVADRCF